MQYGEKQKDKGKEKERERERREKVHRKSKENEKIKSQRSIREGYRLATTKLSGACLNRIV